MAHNTMFHVKHYTLNDKSLLSDPQTPRLITDFYVLAFEQFVSRETYGFFDIGCEKVCFVGYFQRFIIDRGKKPW